MKLSLQEKKSSFMDERMNKLQQFSCPVVCLTPNPLKTKNRLEGNDLTFFLTESSNYFKRQILNTFSTFESKRLSGKIQITGPAGVGKSHALGDFVVCEKMINIDSKKSFIIYLHFNEQTNSVCMPFLRNEILAAVYPLIEKELNLLIESNFSLKVKENTLLNLIMKTFITPNQSEGYLDLIEDIIVKIKNDYPEKTIILVFDQINEIEKNPHQNSYKNITMSKRLFDKILQLQDKVRFNLVICASNNNSFNRCERMTGNSDFFV